MKLFFSLFISLPLWATPILITYDKAHEEALWVVEGLQKDFLIPIEMMEMQKRNNPCDQIHGPNFWHLCITNSGDLIEVSAQDYFVLNSIKSFKR
jgi:hypothetical protein